MLVMELGFQHYMLSYICPRIFYCNTNGNLFLQIHLISLLKWV